MIKIPTTALMAAALLSFGSLCAAATSPQEVQVAGPALRPVSDAEFQNIKGRYTMSDGRWLRVHRHGDVQVRAELQGENAVVLRVAGPNHLMSRDGSMNLRFSGDENVSRVKLTIDRRSAQGVSVGTCTLTSVSPSD